MLGVRWRTSDGVLHTENATNRRALADLEKELRGRCLERGDCTLSPARNKHGNPGFRVTYGDGWWFQFTPDVSVVEVQTKPSTLKELRSVEDRLKRDVFGAAEKLALFPHPEKGGGHIHMDMPSAFGAAGEEARLFRNFVVDQFNSDQALRIFQSRKHGPAFSELGAGARKEMERVLEEFDSGRLKSISELRYAIDHRVYNFRGLGRRFTRLDLFREDREEREYLRKYTQALRFNFTQSVKVGVFEGTTEFRGLPAQRSTEDLLLEAELIQSRIDFLRKSGAKVPLRPDPRGFAEWLCETGLDPTRFRVLESAGVWQTTPLGTEALRLCAEWFAPLER